jgi:hypothetical protein
MANILNRMLPIYSLRERKAQRLVHEKRKDHELACVALNEATQQYSLLKNQSKNVLSNMLSCKKLNALEARWMIDHSAELQQNSEAIYLRLPNLEEKKQTSLKHLNESNLAYIHRVHKSDVVKKASNQLDINTSKLEARTAEQVLEDEFLSRRSVDELRGENM